MATAALVLALIVGAGAVGVGAPSARGQESARRGFTESERTTLEGGRLVERRRLERRGGQVQFGGTSYQRIDRPVDEVWRAVREPSAYRDLLPQTESVRVVARRRAEAVIRIEHAYSLIHAAYHLHLRFSDERHDLSFDLDASRPNDVASIRGFLSLSPWPGDRSRTLVQWGILAAVDEGLVGGMLRPQVHDWILRVPSTMRSYLQGRGRELFLADSR